jgi:YYY domain-containing protein
MYSNVTQESRLSRLQEWLLALILICGAVLRFYDLAWDHGTLPHPDERSTVAFYAPSLRWPEGLEQALDPRRSPLNPFWDVEAGHRRSYTYGHFPLYALALTAATIQSLAPAAQALGLPPEVIAFMETARSPVGFALVGRFLMALADTASIYLLFLLGRRLYGTWAGLLAAALSAFTVLQIQLAHFFAVDPISATFVFLALYASILLAERRSIGAASLTGLAAGLAVACKFSALPIVAAPAIALLIHHPEAEAKKDESSCVERPKWALLILVACVALVAFAFTSPFVFLDFQNFWQAVVQEQGDMVTGVADFPFTRQYRGTLPYLYFLEQQVLWGMGPPLGVLALLGLLWVIWRALRRQAVTGEYVILAWLILYFGPTGLFLAKFMRYMAPVTPLLVLFGAGMVAHQRAPNLLGSAGEAEGDSGRRFIALRGIAGGLALLGAVIWALAFVNGVYGAEHPWVTASRWVYQNIPDGACIAAEHWEEGFPQSLPEPGMNPGARGYRQPLLPMYEEDTPGKFQIIKETLKHCDYLVLASNRLWRTIPRLPQRYPMSVRYYEALFSGQLGFEQVYTWSTSPRLGPLVIDDQAADESFTVYDHPRPIIFRKTRQLSDAEWEQLLGGLWEKAIPGYVGPPPALAWLRKALQIGWVVSTPANKAPERPKSLLLDMPVDELPVLSDFRWNIWANNSAALAIVCWWLAVQCVGWLAWPIARRVLGSLSDQGYLLAKTLGWLLVGYGVWMFSSLRVLPNALSTIGVWIAVLLVVSTLLFWRDRQAVRELFRRRWRLILLGEGLFASVFLYFVGLRLLNPDLWQPWNGGEKMLEIGFLNAIVKSAYMPPYDPYFAGGYINYYYYGLFLVGILVKLTGIQPTVAFNLAVPLLAGLTAANVFCLTYHLASSIDANSRREADWCAQCEGHLPTRPLIASLLAVLLVMFIGNLAGFRQLVRYLEDAGGGDFATGLPLIGEAVRALTGLWRVVFEGVRLPPYSFWDPTRVIPDTINEFPYFSFLFADLHPHLIAMPFAVLALALIYGLLVHCTTHYDPLIGIPEEWTRSDPLERLWHAGVKGVRVLLGGSIAIWLTLAFCLGALAATNTWDLPTYTGLATLAFWLTLYRSRRNLASTEKQRTREHWVSQPIGRLIRAAGLGVVTLATGYLLYLPFFLFYQPMDVGIGLVKDKTDLGLFLWIWGLFLFIGFSYLLVSAVCPRSRLWAARWVSLWLCHWKVAPRLPRLMNQMTVTATPGKTTLLWLIVVVLVLTVILWILGYRVIALLLPATSLALILLLRSELSDGESFASLLLFGALLILLGVEIFYLRDFLGGSSYYRMNTLFKFYIQAWILAGVATATLLPELWERIANNWQLARWVPAWNTLMVGLLVASLVYPVFGTRTRVLDRFDDPPPIGTLDGMAYMTTGKLRWPHSNVIELKYDYEAIRWLQEHVVGTPVLAEAKIGYYREGGMRVSSYTGLPMPLGGLHQNEQRWPEQIGRRDGLYMEFWNTADPERAWELIQQLRISYIYLGQLERTLYDPEIAQSVEGWGVSFFDPAGYEKFDTLRAQGRLELVYENPRTRIYRVITAR